jgi:hypothetical protein
MVGKECEEEMNRTWLEILAEDLVLCPPCEDKMIAEKDNEFKLTVEEVRAVLKELEHIYISYENPIATAVIYKMMDFLKEQDNVRKN